MRNKIKVIILILFVALVAASCSYAGLTYIKSCDAHHAENMNSAIIII